MNADLNPYRYIARIDAPKQHTFGWQARPPGRKSRFFSDSKYGGVTGAHVKAVDYIVLPIRQVVRNQLEELALLAARGEPVNVRRHEERILDALLDLNGFMAKKHVREVIG